MKRYQKVIIPLIFVNALILSGCEINRSGDGGAIGPVTEATQVQVQPPAPTEPAPGPTVPPDISTEVFPAPEAPPANEVEPGKVLVKLSPQAAVQARIAELGADNVPETQVSTLDQVLREIGASDLEPVIEPVSEATGEDLDSFSAQAEQVGQLFSISFSPGNDPQAVADRLAQDPAVEFAEPNFIAGITAGPVDIPALLTPNDPYLKYQWNFELIGMPTAWDRATGQGVTVAIVDTGIDFRAPDLANTQRLPGYDFANNDADSTDDQGHGTHVAGTVAQSTNNNLGVTGVAFNARLLPVKVLGGNGKGSYEAIIQGITYAVDQGAKVINMSLAGRAGSQALQDAVRYAHDRGVVVVAAAGNSNGPVEFPAAYDDFVIAVGATRFDNARAPYSDFGPQLDLVAPGGDVDVDQNGDGFADGVLQQTVASSGSGYSYRFFEGTSMASPHVAGVAALILSLNPNLSPNEVKSIMMQTAQNLGASDQFGAGLVQAASAMAAIAPVTPIPPPTTPAPAPTTPAPPPTTPVPTTPVPTTPPPAPTTPVPTTPAPVPTTSVPITPAPVTPAVAGELLTNGGFENDQGWEFGQTPLRGRYDTTRVLSGNRSVKLGATSGADRFSFSSVWQEITIPSQARQVTLTVNVYPISQDKAGTDVQYIAVLNGRFQVIKKLSEGLSNSQIWERRSYDLSDLPGRTVYIYFSVLNRGGTNRLSAMYVDDVSLVWSP